MVVSVETTWVQRFVEAVAAICGAFPSVQLCEEWVLSGEAQAPKVLEDWIEAQTSDLFWTHGPSILAAAIVMADAPRPGAGHLTKPQSLQHLVLMDKQRKKAQSKIHDESARKAFEAMLALAQDRASEIYSSTGAPRSASNMHKAFWSGFNGASEEGLDGMRFPPMQILLASYSAGQEYAIILKKSKAKEKSKKIESKVLES